MKENASKNLKRTAHTSIKMMLLNIRRFYEHWSSIVSAILKCIVIRNHKHFRLAWHNLRTTENSIISTFIMKDWYCGMSHSNKETSSKLRAKAAQGE